MILLQAADLWGCPAILRVLKKKLEKSLQSGEQGAHCFWWKTYIMWTSAILKKTNY